MGFNFNINIKHKVTINGKEYGSLDEVPEEQKDIIQNALNSTATGNSSKLTVNGTGYDTPEAMPPDIRKIYEEALLKAKTVSLQSGIPLPAPHGVEIKPESAIPGWLITTLIILAGLAILFKVILHGF